MGRRLIAALILLILAAGFAPAPKPKPKSNDRKALVGTWEMVAAAVGKKGPPTSIKRQAVIDKDSWTFKSPDGKIATMKYKMTLDASKKPPWLDLELDRVGGCKFRVIGIYEVTCDTF